MKPTDLPAALRAQIESELDELAQLPAETTSWVGGPPIEESIAAVRRDLHAIAEYLAPRMTTVALVLAPNDSEAALDKLVPVWALPAWDEIGMPRELGVACEIRRHLAMPWPSALDLKAPTDTLELPKLVEDSRHVWPMGEMFVVAGGIEHDALLRWVSDRTHADPHDAPDDLLGATFSPTGGGEFLLPMPVLACLWRLIVGPHERQARTLRALLDNIAKGGLGFARLTLAAETITKHQNGDLADKHKDDLAGAVRQHVERLRHDLTVPAQLTEATASELVDSFAEVFAKHLESIGDEGKRRATAVRKQNARRANDEGTDRWVLWQFTASTRFLALLTEAVWLDARWPHVDRQARNRAALVIQVHDDVARVHSRAFSLETRNGQRALVFDDTDPIVLSGPSIADESLAKIVERGTSLLGSVTAHKLLRWEVLTGHEQALQGVPDPRVIAVQGGWSVLAQDVLRIGKKEAANDLRAILHAQQAVIITLPTGGTAHGLLSFHDTPARGRRRGHIEITLGSMLLPHFAHEIENTLGKGRNTSEQKRLVPVLRDLPPMVGRPNEHGALATLSMLVVRELRAHARELAEAGAVEIPQERFMALARKAGLPPSVLRLALDRWVSDGDDAPAFLTSPTPGAYSLAAAHAPELAFIVAAGRRELAAAKGGRLSAQARERARHRVAR